MSVFAPPQVSLPQHFDSRRDNRHSVPRPRLCLHGDDDGSWTLTGSGEADCRFTDFDAALDSARHVPGRDEATIEIWQGGEYVCCAPRKAGWPPPDNEVAGLHGPRLAVVDRVANRAAEFLLPVVGYGFWLAILIIAMAASLGWRLALL